MATIKSLNINLGLISTAFQQGLKGARKQLEDFNDFISSTKGKILGLLSAVGLGLSLNEIKHWTIESMNAGASALKWATTLKMATENLMGLQAMAKRSGIEAGEFNTLLVRLGKNLAIAAQEGDTSNDAMARLGLSAKTLANQPLDKSLLQIATALKGVKNPAEQAIIATDLFGRGGAALLPMLNKGGEGIEQFIEHAKHLGVALNDVDAAKLLNAKAALMEVGERIEGMKNQMAVALAPAIEAIATQLIGLMPTADTLREYFINALRYIVKGVAVLIDAWYVLKTAVLGIATGIMAALTAVIWVVQKLAEAIVWCYNLIPGNDVKVPDLAGDMAEMTKSLASQTAEAAGQIGQAQAKVDGFFDDVQKSAEKNAQALLKNKKDLIQPIQEIGEAAADNSKKIKDVLQGLQKDIATFGMGEGQKKLFDLKAMGASPEQLKQAEAFVKQLDDLQKKQTSMDEGKKLAESLQTPVEKYDAAIAKYDALLKDKSISEETYYRAVEKAQDDLRSSLPQMEKQQFHRAGVQEQRFSFSYHADREVKDPMQDIGKQQLAIQKRIADAAEKQADLLAEKRQEGEI